MLETKVCAYCKQLYQATGNIDICPRCRRSNDTTLWDRIIGYLTKIKNWSAGRQIEQKTRVYEHFEGGETC